MNCPVCGGIMFPDFPSILNATYLYCEDCGHIENLIKGVRNE